MLHPLHDKVVAVYGGTSGIGKELTSKFTSLGACVIFLGTNKEKGCALQDCINKQAGSTRAVFHMCDVTDWSLQEALYDVAAKQFGKTVDIVIIVAGILESSDLLNDAEQDGSYRTLEVNLAAAAKATRTAVQHFIKNDKPGLVIHTSSIYGFCGAPLAPLYAASKHGILGLAKSYGTLFRSTNIRVNAVAPHFVDTPMVSGPSKDVATALGMVPMSRCVSAYMHVIEDETLNGDVITVTAQGMRIEPRYSDPIYEKLDELCSHRKAFILDEIKRRFHV
ncbi:hypothetical protein O0I10_000300 [Lichtheimia ornata]|uniref:NAD(P)-binding protein n=1 Tax=Lichtheimia ornata TaxID=688661 RepID=A0AAD8DJW4_9FUNG|nr:uncharacterized protein O0I10_000300 [Lichtheimia ornata]KAJ8664022.1 hypothetical protein O0I10_000300 [Lichtheimia ornata]